MNGMSPERAQSAGPIASRVVGLAERCANLSQDAKSMAFSIRSNVVKSPTLDNSKPAPGADQISKMEEALLPRLLQILEAIELNLELTRDSLINIEQETSYR